MFEITEPSKKSFITTSRGKLNHMVLIVNLALYPNCTHSIEIIIKIDTVQYRFINVYCVKF